MMREVATKTSDLAGDGTTTAVVVAQAIAHEDVRAVVGGIDPMELKRGIDLAVAAAVEDVKRRSRKVGSRHQIAQAATISANGERAIGDLVADAMDKVSHDGVVTVRGGRVRWRRPDHTNAQQLEPVHLSFGSQTSRDEIRLVRK
jgi:chaperonin GroEL